MDLKAEMRAEGQRVEEILRSDSTLAVSSISPP
jgi:hypothetical protein